MSDSMKSALFFYPRISALFLSLALTLPPPVFALRPQPIKQQKAGLEDLEKVLGVPPPSAGAEEVLTVDEAVARIKQMAAADANLTDVRFEFDGVRKPTTKSLKGVSDWGNFRGDVYQVSTLSKTPGKVRISREGDVIVVGPAAGLEEAIERWLSRPFDFLKEPLTAVNTVELLSTTLHMTSVDVKIPVEGRDLWVPSMLELVEVDRIRPEPAPGIADTFTLFVQGDVLPEDLSGLMAAFRLKGRYPNVQLEYLPALMSDTDVQVHVEWLKVLGRGKPKAMYLLNQKTLEQFDGLLAGANPFDMPVLLVGIRPGALVGTGLDGLLAYLFQLLRQADHLIINRIESSFTPSSKQTTYFLRSLA